MEFRNECGQCHRSLAEDDPAYLCVNECTFCATCYRQLKYVCPNCSGELVRRPRRHRMEGHARPGPRGPNEKITVRRARVGDLDSVALLFDAYRQFYEQSADPAAARKFLSERLSRDESVVLVAEHGGTIVGFTQLYPLFSSVSLGPTFLLNDLFVDPHLRQRGVGALLLEAAREYGRTTGAHYLELSTAVDNPAQHLYESAGWSLDREFLHYELPLRTTE